MKYILILLAAVFILSCSEDDTPRQNPRVQDDNDPADTNLTPEEKFSSALLVDFLAESDDEDLADFLETTVYKMSFSYTGVLVAEISPAAWLVMFEKDSTVKNYLLQKFVDVTSNDYYFRLKETTLTFTDIIIRGRQKEPAGQ